MSLMEKTIFSDLNFTLDSSVSYKLQYRMKHNLKLFKLDNMHAISLPILYPD
jgi:hypothetical protein